MMNVIGYSIFIIGCAVLQILLKKEILRRKDAEGRCKKLDRWNLELTAELRRENTFRKRIADLLLHDRDDLLDSLNVKDDHPVLRSVLTLMEAKCQAHVEAAAIGGLSPDEAKAEVRCAAAMQEMQEIILETAEEARKANA